MTESSLSYLGMGVQEPVPSWGAMLKVGQGFLRTSPRMAILPGLFILVVASVPKLRRRWPEGCFDPRVTKG